jgi:GT2 family glycosyltransferase
MHLHQGRPRISTIVAVLNAEATLGAQLEALAGQTYQGPWELILADNGSTDASVQAARSYEGRIPLLRVIDASATRGAAHARNQGARHAVGDILAFCDADDVVSPGWLEAIAARASCCALVGGRLDFQQLNAPRWPIIVDEEGLEVHLGFLRIAPGGNLAIPRDAFEKLGGFVESYLAGEDVDFSWRAQLAGYPIVYAPEAVVACRPKETLRGLMRQVHRAGRTDVRLYRDYRHAGLSRDPVVATVKTSAWLLLHLPSVLRARDRRTRWAQWVAYRTGRVRGSVEHRVLFV